MSEVSTDELAAEVVLAILCADPFLEPKFNPAIVDDGQQGTQVNGVVKADFTGRSIEVLDDYSVTITLDREYNTNEATPADFMALWARVRRQIDNWLEVFLDLDIRSKVDHLTIEQIDASGEPAVVDNTQSYTLNFVMFIKPV